MLYTITLRAVLYNTYYKKIKDILLGKKIERSVPHS